MTRVALVMCSTGASPVGARIPFGWLVVQSHGTTGTSPAGRFMQSYSPAQASGSAKSWNHRDKPGGESSGKSYFPAPATLIGSAVLS